jgi:thiamine-phosphate pyrophosphorylase
MIKIPKIQYITRDDHRYTHAEQARLAFKSGVEWVQIRMKSNTPAEIIEQSRLAVTYANSCGGKLIVNDSVDIAREVKAHGIHLGLKDTPVDQARRILGDTMIIGGTANTLDEVVRQTKRGADYVGVGPFRYTVTKKNLSPVLGLEGYKDIVKGLEAMEIIIPLVAVGGITPDDIPALTNAGITGVAISGGLFDQLTT